MVASVGRYRKTSVCSGINGGALWVPSSISFSPVASLPFLALSLLTGHSLYLFLRNCHQPGVEQMLARAELHVCSLGLSLSPFEPIFSVLCVFRSLCCGESIAFKQETIWVLSNSTIVYSDLNFPWPPKTEIVLKNHPNPAAKSLLFKAKQVTDCGSVRRPGITIELFYLVVCSCHLDL